MRAENGRIHALFTGFSTLVAKWTGSHWAFFIAGVLVATEGMNGVQGVPEREHSESPGSTSANTSSFRRSREGTHRSGSERCVFGTARGSAT